jgi:Uma2 family endonuclease
MTTPALLTADDLMRLQPPDKRTELVRGRMIVREPAGFRHGDIATTIATRLHPFVAENNLGRVLAAETGFKLFTDPDTVRATDVAFVRHERIPDPIPRGFAPFAPDLAVEVLSPDDRPDAVLEKIADWLKAGTQMVWVIDHDRRQARIHRSDGSVSVVGESGTLDGEDLLPGFGCRLTEVIGHHTSPTPPEHHRIVAPPARDHQLDRPQAPDVA